MGCIGTSKTIRNSLKMYLFFDTETTGLPKNWRAPITDLDNWPRLVQIAWILADDQGNRLEIKDHIIKPEDFSIPQEAANVHGISTERALAVGVSLDKVLNTFAKLVDQADYIVAHNIAFDEKIIRAEFMRRNFATSFESKPKLCTMKSSTNYCQIPGNYGYKWPKLSELHIKLFGEDFHGAHDASADINATDKCFWKMREYGLI